MDKSDYSCFGTGFAALGFLAFINGAFGIGGFMLLVGIAVAWVNRE